LTRLEDVDLVSPVPNTDDSTAEVFLKDKRLPPLDRWHEQFRKLAHGTYEMRGVEVTLQGRVQVRDGVLSIAILDDEATVRVEPLSAAEKIQWDHRMRRRIPPAKDEDSAYRRLQSALAGRSGAQTITITGPLIQTGGAYSLQVRHFSI
jgi:galactose oxidase